MQKLFLFFKSVKLAVVLLIVIALTSILATLIPQGRELAFYYHTYNSFIASLIVNAQLDNYFRSFFFVLCIILFFINLSVCTVNRLYREFTGRRKRRFGPDMIHIGLLVLIIGSLVTFIGRREGFMYMAAGDEIKLPGGYVVELESFEFLTYDDGKPKDWISTVDVYKDDEQIVDSFAIEVNKPLNVGKIDVFQSSYAEESRAYFSDQSGRTVMIQEGRPLETPSAVYVFSGIFADPDSPGKAAAFFEKYINRESSGIVKLAPNDELEGWILGDFGVYNVTGLQAVIDPGFLPALIGLILAGLGLAITYLQKIGDKEI